MTSSIPLIRRHHQAEFPRALKPQASEGSAAPGVLGVNVARLLAGAWREASDPSDPACQLTTTELTEAELTEITPLVCQSGAGALAWWKIRDTPLAQTDAGRTLHEVYRRFRLSARLHERDIAHAFSILNAAGIDAVLVKGWSIARRYPDRALRPYGDIDLCIAPEQFEKAERALAGVANIDLHRGFSRIGQTKPETGRMPRLQPRMNADSRGSDQSRIKEFETALSNPRSSAFIRGRILGNLWLTLRGSTKSDNWTELFARTEVVECAGEPVRILGDEDHLRLLCMHLLRSGARRPPWLCDVALLLEEVQAPSRSPTVRKGSPVQHPSGSPTVSKGSAVSADFDWDICLGSNPVHANWVAIAIKLAHELLGANIQAEDPRQRTECAVSKLQIQELPRWLVPAVLKQWGRRGNAPSGSPTVGKGSASNLSAMSAAKDQRALPNGRASAWIRPWTLDLGPWTNLYRRWDNPIRATAAVGGRFNNWPRLPYRLAESIVRVGELRGRQTADRRRQTADGRRQRGSSRESLGLARSRNF